MDFAEVYFISVFALLAVLSIICDSSTCLLGRTMSSYSPFSIVLASVWGGSESKTRAAGYPKDAHFSGRSEPLSVSSTFSCKLGCSANFPPDSCFVSRISESMLYSSNSPSLSSFSEFCPGGCDFRDLYSTSSDLDGLTDFADLADFSGVASALETILLSFMVLILKF